MKMSSSGLKDEGGVERAGVSMSVWENVDMKDLVSGGVSIEIGAL